MSLTEALRLVLHHQAAGDSKTVSALCKQILQSISRPADALLVSGMLAYLQGQHTAALQHAAQATALRADDPLATEKLAITFKDIGFNEQAAQLLETITPLDSDSFFRQASYGQVLQSLNRFDEAIARYRCALQLQPDFVPIRAAIGSLLALQNRHAEAEPELRQALLMNPEANDVAGNLGITLCELGQYADAEPLLRRALAHTQPPTSVNLLNYLGLSLKQQQKNKEAEAVFRQSLEQQPNNPYTWNSLGVLLNILDQAETAEKAFRQALALLPNFHAAHNNLGRVLIKLSKATEAEQALQTAAEHYPQDPTIGANLAIALLLQGKHTQARERAEATIKACPDATDPLHTILYAMNCELSCTPEQYLHTAKQFGDITQRKATPFTQWHAALPGVHAEPLRIGFVSGDMRTHPVGFFLENLARHIDPKRLQLIAYKTGGREDALTARLKPYFSQWSDISMLSDADAAAKIHHDGIHVLADLAGHTTHNRLSLFAWKAAPLQISWLGYFASTGVSAIDYILVDKASVREDEHKNFTERVWYLPETRLCFTPPDHDEAGEVAALPAMQRGYITFASFQNMIKLNNAVLALWARVLSAVPNSRLRIQNAAMSTEEARQALLTQWAAHGIDPQRIDLLASVSRRDYFTAHADVDIILDSFPYPGGTTTCEALWMGVPTLTLTGNTLLSRQGASLLGAAGLPAWIAHNEADYVACAVRHTADLTTLATLRATLRAQTDKSPLCDGPRFARHFENAIHDMWRTSTPPLSPTD